MEKLVVELTKSFKSKHTLDVEFRISQLECLEKLISENKALLKETFLKDFRQSEYEVDIEFSYTLATIKYTKDNLKKWLQPKDLPKESHHQLNLIQTVYEPYGVTLVICPWNYPIILTFEPLSAAIAAGNCVIMKPSEMTPTLSELIMDLCHKYLDNRFYRVVCGDKEVATELLEQRFDYIFYTGSTHVGKIVMKAASKYLTPVTLELGGKCPCYVDENVELNLAAKRVAWGKVMNAGQICVSVDYLLCHEKVYDEFVKKVQEAWDLFFDKNPQTHPDYSRVINKAHFRRIKKILENTKGKIVYGGSCDEDDLYVSPTLVVDWTLNDYIMEEEVFAPILPIYKVKSCDEAIDIINKYEKPLCVYTMTSDDNINDRFIKETASGHFVSNEIFLQIAIREFPFGGVGASGVGKYHGSYSIENFSNQKSVYIKKNFKAEIEQLTLPPMTKQKIEKAAEFF